MMYFINAQSKCKQKLVVNESMKEVHSMQRAYEEIHYQLHIKRVLPKNHLVKQNPLNISGFLVVMEVGSGFEPL